jgi:hypothetical protein
LKKEKKRDRFEDDIMKTILEKEETDDFNEKPMEIFSESLKGYVKDIKELQTGGQIGK